MEPALPVYRQGFFAENGDLHRCGPLGYNKNKKMQYLPFFGVYKSKGPFGGKKEHRGRQASVPPYCPYEKG